MSEKHSEFEPPRTTVLIHHDVKMVQLIDWPSVLRNGVKSQKIDEIWTAMTQQMPHPPAVVPDLWKTSAAES